jgi:hypothetical protein
MLRSALLRSTFLLTLPLAVGACSNAKPDGKEATPGTALGGIQQHFNLNWAQEKLWEDGLAEVATYAAERVVYNKPRQFELTIITVKEDFNKAFNVKTDDYQRNDLFPVMKVNVFGRIPTDNYPYHYLTSIFFRREQPLQVHKLTSSSQEWCGNTFKAITDEGKVYRLAYNSYWDNQGNGQRELQRDVLLEDALPYTLRGLRFNDQPLFEANVLETQQTSKAAEPVLYRAEFRVSRAPRNEAPREAWRVNVRLAQGKESVYWFDQQYPHVLVRQQTWDNRTLRLTDVRRYAYWQH